jgi:hypothetical protein
MNLTLSIKDELLKKAREAAQAQGKTVNQLVRDYLEQFAGQQVLEDSINRFKQSSRKGNRKGWHFNRDELHERT